MAGCRIIRDAIVVNRSHKKLNLLINPMENRLLNNNERRTVARIGLVMFLITASIMCGGARAWESDFHYGLTKWLAFQAGFGIDDAEIIAAAAQSPDETSVLSATSVMFGAVCFGHSFEASRHVQQYHFPSDGPIPAARADRIVMPGVHSKIHGGNRWINQEILLADNASAPITRLYRLGIALHPLEDSWSHGGMPDKIALCPAALTWSHPKTRGGYRSHNADLTHKYPRDALETAQTAHVFLRQFLVRNPKFYRNDHEDWGVLRGTVEDFVQRDTAREKLDWFKAQNDVPLSSFSTYPCFLRHTTLKGHSKICKAKTLDQREEYVDRNDETFRSPVIPREVSEFASKFLEQWIIQRNLSAALSFISSDRVIDSFADREPPLSSPAGEVLEAMLSVWLIEDHGVANDLDHGLVPARSVREQWSLAEETQGLIRFNNLSAALQSDSERIPYAIYPLESTEEDISRYGLEFDFNHAIRDMLLITIEREGTNIVIVGFDWLAM